MRVVVIHARHHPLLTFSENTMSEQNYSRRWRLNSRDVASTIANTTIASGAWVAVAVVAEQFAQDGIEQIETEKGIVTFLGQLIVFILIKMAANALRDPDKKGVRDWLTKALGWFWGLVTSRDESEDTKDDSPQPEKKRKRLFDRIFRK